MKKIIVLALVFCLAFTGGVFAASGIKLVVNGTTATGADVKVIDGVTYLPLRAIGNLLGVPVSWNGTTKTVTVGTGTASGGTTSVENVYRVGAISFLNVQTKNGTYGWDVDCEVRNNDTKDYVGLFFTAIYYDGNGVRLGTATGVVSGLKKGETKTVTMFTSDDLSGYTKIKFQIDLAY